MSGYKHIETSIARYIAGRYNSAMETGAGNNLHTARLLFRSGILKRCTDITIPDTLLTIPYFKDDVADPNRDYYSDVECIYSIRPLEEMIPWLIRLSQAMHADLLIYHLGFEGTDRPSPVAGCSVPLHRYVSFKN